MWSAEPQTDVAAVFAADDGGIVGPERTCGVQYRFGRQGRGVGAQDEDGLRSLPEEARGRVEHPLAKVLSHLREETDATGKQRLDKIQGTGRGSRDGGRPQSTRLLRRVGDEGRL